MCVQMSLELLLQKTSRPFPAPSGHPLHPAPPFPPAATQHEVCLQDAQQLVAHGCKYLLEGGRGSCASDWRSRARDADLRWHCS